jgi:hypothetical protein
MCSENASPFFRFIPVETSLALCEIFGNASLVSNEKAMCKFKHLIERRCQKFFPELLVVTELRIIKVGYNLSAEFGADHLIDS